MLRRLWYWLFGEPERAMEQLVERLLQAQQDTQREAAVTQQAVMQAVRTMGDASAKQAEVLSSYLKLFQAGEEPKSWSPDDELREQTEKDLITAGFPVNGSDKEQAEFVIKHLELFE